MSHQFVSSKSLVEAVGQELVEKIRGAVDGWLGTAAAQHTLMVAHNRELQVAPGEPCERRYYATGLGSTSYSDLIMRTNKPFAEHGDNNAHDGHRYNLALLLTYLHPLLVNFERIVVEFPPLNPINPANPNSTLEVVSEITLKPSTVVVEAAPHHLLSLRIFQQSQVPTSETPVPTPEAALQMVEDNFKQPVPDSASSSSAQPAAQPITRADLQEIAKELPPGTTFSIPPGADKRDLLIDTLRSRIDRLDSECGMEMLRKTASDNALRMSKESWELERHALKAKLAAAEATAMSLRSSSSDALQTEAKLAQLQVAGQAQSKEMERLRLENAKLKAEAKKLVASAGAGKR
jgi:hypothetical protein